MQKAASVTVRLQPAMKARIEALAQTTRRSRSYVIEEALAQYLEVNEWQINGIIQALSEADSPEAEFIDHDQVLTEWETRLAN